MMQLIDLRDRTLSRAELLSLIPRPELDPSSAAHAAGELIAAVRERGAAALADQAERFDGVRPQALRVEQSDIDAAVESLDPAVRRALDEAIARVRAGSAGQVPAATTTILASGATVTQRWQPVGRVGLYVPGGKAVYPSSVVMNAVAAQVAGVASIALASPAQKEFGGSVHPVILGAAGLLGLTEIYAIGGAGAIGAFAYGVPELGLEPVDVVTGPGNVFVAAAKRLVQGRVGIDSEAGATEILVIADASADAALVAADLVSQAEHDELASAVLVTDSVDLVEQVGVEIAAQAARTNLADRVAISLGAKQSAVVLVDSLDRAVDFSNAYSPEHLEIMTTDPHATLAGIENAGAVFLGPWTPVSLGDYMAGSNHVLPTGGTARFASGLGAHTFLRPQQVIEYGRAALADVRERVVALAHAEGLHAHGDAVEARFPSDDTTDTPGSSVGRE
ncbi:MAG: histidinol dehydrogenase [Naasia sp.]